MSLRFVLVVILSISMMLGQTGTSRVRGVVMDTSSALVPGATVTATHEATGLTRTVLSNASGQYGFDAMPPGKYTVTVTLQGFKKVSSTGNDLQVGEPLTIDLTLEPGAVSEQVMVSETSAQVQTAEA